MAASILASSAPEEIAYINQWISKDNFTQLAMKLGKTKYGQRLLDLFKL
jgi:dTDP-glucose pyrophosphorylase